MPYIEAPKPETGEGNPFAVLPKCDDDKSVYILYRGETIYLVLNKFPYNAGHLLAIPYREVGSLQDLEKDERTELMDTIIRGQDILQKALNPDGFNVGFNLGRAAGAGIPSHLHAHIVPRWNGDHNFMPVVSDTRVLPESLDSMWERLRPFAK
ncbi:HIT domain-containing protein [Rubellicoccus peritrichatus]|uniref:HIT domain-containing protein n=1 Tax=Rubellicoccus peritrichatus TaxID=3080537 RepID=A0AAQ3L805_9BACT|nr:HIT domain-containing protein [Puniceicoccus sp. CR14]WOO40362.1 HIT domain-containing protein [Puniceicoccus sp. CR14]